jgi:aspartate ammonia-lyase
MNEFGERFRVERDSLGERELDARAGYGVHTLRAVENFPVYGLRVCDVPEFGRALGMVKLAALRANVDCGVLGPPVSSALEDACGELAHGAPSLLRELILPVIQGGAGTSTNMNVNEVLANRALEVIGQPPGAYEHCHPNDHVNRSQSTNDVYPTALRIALLMRQRQVDRTLAELINRLIRRAEANRGARKLGRTQLQDAVLLTAADELLAWADQCRQGRRQLAAAAEGLLEVNLGGTAIGTGLATPEGYADSVLAHLRQISGYSLRTPKRLVSATSDPSPLLAFSAALRGAGVTIAKLADDLRLLASGPRTGLAEVDLPPVQAGSSMMPGKVNPVIPEFVNQLIFRVHGADTTATLALGAGQLQLNAMLPVVAHELFQAQEALSLAAETLSKRCIEGLRYRRERVSEFAAQGLDGPTQVAASAGYGAAADLVREALEGGGAPGELGPSSDFFEAAPASHGGHSN